MAVTIDSGPQDGPDRIVSENSRERTMGERLRGTVRAFTTKEGLVGNYDYAFLFKPNLPFMKKSKRRAPFFGLQDRMPVLLGLLLGFQHALSMLAGIITPPILIAGSAYFDTETTQYLVSTSLIVSGLLSAVQITRFKVMKTPYYIGTGLISVVGTSFAIIPLASKGFSQMYANGMCKTAEDGTPLPCPEGYGALLGTASLCALLEIGLSFMTPKLLKKLFPPIVTGPTFIGLGFSVFITIIICERFGSPIMKSLAVVLGLLVGCIIAAACGYFDSSGITAAPAASFIWVKTFPLSVYGPFILPLLAIYLILMMEAIGDITATCDVSRLQVDGVLFDSRIQGGVLADGLNGMLAGLCTITPCQPLLKTTASSP
ncbi:purine permease [Botrytis cinerea]